MELAYFHRIVQRIQLSYFLHKLNWKSATLHVHYHRELSAIQLTILPLHFILQILKHIDQKAQDVMSAQRRLLPWRECFLILRRSFSVQNNARCVVNIVAVNVNLF